jgi:hypothetical protein
LAIIRKPCHVSNIQKGRINSPDPCSDGEVDTGSSRNASTRAREEALNAESIVLCTQPPRLLKLAIKNIIYQYRNRNAVTL